MPPQYASRLVLPDGNALVRIHLSGPAALHPPQFGFAVNSDDTDAIGNALGEWIGVGPNNFAARLYEEYAIDKIVIRTSDSTVEVGVNEQGTGDGGGTIMPPAVSALIKVQTAGAGRRGSGRMYWPGVLAEQDVDNAGIIDGAVLTSLQDVADKLIADLATEDIDMVLLHSYRWLWGPGPERAEDPGVPVGFPDPTVVTGLAAQRLVATQRRRQR